ncbi:MAG: DUF1285 domain-containing protein [Pseudomonadales bacterium]
MSELQSLFDTISSVEYRDLPPIEKWHPDRTASIDIEIRSDGSWWHEGSEIVRKELRKLFASILRLEEDQEYYLVTPVEKLKIIVADAPLMIVESTRFTDEESQSHIAVRTNMDDSLQLGEEHCLELRADIPYVYVRRGLWAKVNRSVYYEWVEWGEQRMDGEHAYLALKSGNSEFTLGAL